MADLETKHRKIIEDYLATLRRGAAEPEHAHGYLDFWHDDIQYVLPGLWPWGGVYKGKDAYLKEVMPDYADRSTTEKGEGNPGAGLYGYEYICEGNTVVAKARSRGRDARGYPYTNHFFLWFEFDDHGKIIWYMDSADFSSGWQANWGVHLE